MFFVVMAWRKEKYTYLQILKDLRDLKVIAYKSNPKQMLRKILYITFNESVCSWY